MENKKNKEKQTKEVEGKIKLTDEEIDMVSGGARFRDSNLKTDGK